MLQLFERNKLLLEDLFGPEWFRSATRIQDHPAYRRWVVCRDMLVRGGSFSFPFDHDQFMQVVAMILDHGHLATVSGGTSAFSLGNFANYGDAAVRRRIRAVAHDAKQYRSLQVELAIAGWCAQSDGLCVTPYSSTAFADFRIDIGSDGTSVLLECKCIEEGTKASRLSKITQSANAQIKAVGLSVPGVLLVNISNMVPQRPGLSDNCPDEVSQIRAQFEAVLQRSNRSVSATLLTWDEYAISNNDREHATFVSLRRRSLTIDHLQPRYKLPKDNPLRSYGNTVVMRVNKEPTRRNSMCTCGSGEKYKTCCGKLK